MHSFTRLNVDWPNGMKISNNYTTFPKEYLRIPPRESKIIFYIKYLSEIPTNEYGFIHLETSDNTNIVVPILINIKKYVLNTFPGFLNFGLCEIGPYNRKNFVKMIPLLIMNYGKEDVEVKRVYIDYEDKFLHFHKSPKIEKNAKIIVRKNSHIKYGYVIFDGEYGVEKEENFYFGKTKKGVIYIETNSTVNPLLQLEYYYMLDFDKIISNVDGNLQNFRREKNDIGFDLRFKYDSPEGFGIDVNYIKSNGIYNKDGYIISGAPKILKGEKIRYNWMNKEGRIKEGTFTFIIHFDLNHLDKFYHRYIYFPFLINSLLYVVIPIEIDNSDLDLIFYNSANMQFSFPLTLQNYGRLDKYNNLKMQKYIISSKFQVGSSTGKIDRKYYLYIVNDNSYPIKLTKIKTDNVHFTLDLEDFYSLERAEVNAKNYDFSLSGKLPAIIRNNSIKDHNNNSLDNNIDFNLYPKTATLFSINIQTDNKYNKTFLEGDINLEFDNSNGVVLNSRVNLLLGDFSVSPSNIKFDPAFPGLRQSKFIFCKNMYQVPLDIISVTSSDDRIIPVLLEKKIEAGKKINVIEIVFKPDMNSLIKNYFNEFEIKKSLTYKDLYFWKKNEEYWEDLGIDGKTEINADIVVVTNLKNKIINARSFVIKPNLVKKEEIDYGLIQVGQIVGKYIEGYNPSDSVLEMRLFLAPDYYNDANIFSREDFIFDKNHIEIMLGCTFVVNQNNTIKNYFEYVVINEDINLDNNYNNSMMKEDLIRKLHYYGNSKVKNYLYHSENVLCHYENKNLHSNLLSQELNKEIEIIKNMTTNKIKNNNSRNKYINIWRLFLKLILKIFNYFIFKKEEDYQNNQLKENKNMQSFYLHENISKNIYHIEPHQKFTIGPIIFNPNNTGKVSNVLLLKNNLTILYPIKLRGEGGSGQLTFRNYYKDMKNKKTDIFNNTNFIIEINRDIYVNKMKYQNNLTRIITISNSGNLPLIIKNITIDNNACQTDDLKVMQCKEFLLDIGESMNIDFEITTNFQNYITNRVVKFHTDYQSFEINVIIIISKDLYEQKILYWKMSKTISLTFIPLLISVFILRKIFSSNEKESKTKIKEKKFSNENIETKPGTIIEKKFKENEYSRMINVKKKGKNKKNKKTDIEPVFSHTNTNTNIIDKYFKKVNVIPADETENNKKEKNEITTPNTNININKSNKTFGVIVLKRKKLI